MSAAGAVAATTAVKDARAAIAATAAHVRNATVRTAAPFRDGGRDSADRHDDRAP